MRGVLLLTVLSCIGIQRVPAFNPFDVSNTHNTLDDVYLKQITNAKEVIGTPMRDEEVTFYLFKRGSDNSTQFFFNDPSIASNVNGRLYFIVHGWTESKKVDWYRDLTNAILNRDPTAHVVQVDWSGPASTKVYEFAVYNTEDVGRILANLIHKLVKRCSQPLEDVVVIGHSLGGQIAGFAAKGYKVLTVRKRRLPRIIALDPAGPVYTNRPDTKRLNREDADDVVVIHTDGGVLGIMAPCGTLDFFPNGGYAQPGCFGLTCSHWRSWTFFIEAVDNMSKFEALKCDSWDAFKGGKCGSKRITETMGNALWTRKTGRFYSRTNMKSPFSLPLESGASLFPKWGL